VLAYGLYNAGVSRLSAARASVMLNMIPVIAFLISWVWLGERLNAAQMAFAALTLAGVFLAQKNPRPIPA
jgi:drug/metabolite transporter (DMT)-like permease